MNASSPASSGPAGSHFEGQVGAHYLLSLLIGAEPRGLPGTTIDRVEFQRAAEDHPLDDIIIHARDERGQSAVLEIQVKRRLTFAPSDQEFRQVVTQVVETSQRPEFFDSRYELAIAIARGSAKIEGAYQDVLTWAPLLIHLLEGVAAVVVQVKNEILPDQFFWPARHISPFVAKGNPEPVT